MNHFCRAVVFPLILAVSSAACAQPAPEAAGPLRLGLAGMTHSHVHLVLRRAKDADLKIVGIAEPNEELGRRLLRQYGLESTKLYDTLEAMLAEAKPEAVAAFNSIHGHLAVVEACAPLGIHVMVEKPLAVNARHARRMAKLAREHEVLLLTNYETTWYGSNHELYRRLVSQREFGEVRKLVVHDGHRGPIEIGCNPEFLEWLTDPVLNGGGAIVDFGCYGANLSTWIMQNRRPQSVTAVTQQIKPDKYPNVDDEATILLTYPEAQVVIQASWNWPLDRKDLHAYGESGYLKTIDQSRMVWRQRGQKEETRGSAPERPEPRHDPFTFLRAAVRGEIDPAGGLSSLENNLIVVDILDAARRSAETGVTVRLDEND